MEMEMELDLQSSLLGLKSSSAELRRPSRKRGENPDIREKMKLIREKMKLIPSRRIVGDGGGAPVSSKYSRSSPLN
ncbi:hypothetical protein Dimus_006711 [Dionaea muscipula]